MIRSVIMTVWSRVPLRGHEALFFFALLLGGIVLWWQHSAIATMEVERVLHENALKAAQSVTQEQQQRHEIDLQVVSDWVQGRETQRQVQREILDTTFLEYFSVTDTTEESVEPPPTEDTSRHADPTPTPSSPTWDDEPDRMDILARGMRDTYCRASPDAPDCTAPSSD